MRLSMVTDEVSADVETALELAVEWRLDGVELRGVGEARWPTASEVDQRRVPELLRRSGLPLAAISPGLFKIATPDAPRPETQILRWEDASVSRRAAEIERTAQAHLTDLLPAAIESARSLGCSTIVCFSFDRGPGVPPGPAPELVVDALRQAAATVGAAGMTLAVEVEHICWGDDGRRTAQLVERVGHPALGINWDPANAYRAGEDRPYPDGWQEVRDHVRHVHYKQASTDDEGRRGFTLDGVVDWDGQIRALMNAGYDGWISVEPHVRPKIAGTRETIARLRRQIEGAL